MPKRECHKDDPRVPFLCSCDDCSRAAARQWHGYMDRVLDGRLALDEANRLMDGYSVTLGPIHQLREDTDE